MSKRKLFASVGGAVLLLAPCAGLAQSPVTIEEVIVTAQRFQETAQKAPVIIEVLSANQLVGVTDVRQLQAITPGVAVSVAGNVPQTFIRGMGSQNATLNQEASVAYNVDGTVLFTPTMITPLMFDLDRVEILKGPQGTLYGRNASAGVVNLITNGAKLGDAASGYLEGEAGNFQLRRFTGAVNLPLTDKLAIRVAGQHAEHDGYLSDGSDNQDITAGRIRLLWEPTSAVSLKVGVDASTNNSISGESLNPNPTGDKWIGQLDPRVLSLPPQYQLLVFPPLPPYHFRDDNSSVFSQLDVDLGFATLTVLPAYRHEDFDEGIYNVIRFTEQAKTDQTSLEVRLARQRDRYRWVVGAYYFKTDQDIVAGPFSDIFMLGSTTHQKYGIEAYAIFGETTFSVTDNIRLIGGLRYTNERSTNRALNNTYLANPAAPPALPQFDPSLDLNDYASYGKSSADAVTWKAGAELDVAVNSLLFATASRGFKGGGTYVDLPGLDTSFAPEYVTAYELGSRNRVFGNTLQLNAELFYWKLEGQQLPYLGVNSAGGITLITANVGQAHNYGADLDLVWRPVANSTLHLGVEYLKAKYDDFVRIMPTVGVLPTTLCATSPVIPGFTTRVDCSGMQALRAPTWSGQASYDQRFDLGNGSDITATVSGNFASSRYLDPVYTPEFKQSASATFDASLTYNAAGKDLAITAWIRNIGDARVMTGGTEQFLPVVHASLLPPRTYGVTVRKSF